MITEEKLQQLYNTLLWKKSVKRQELTGIGFTWRDILALQENGTVERMSRGIYQIKNLDVLIEKALEFQANKRYINSMIPFSICHEREPENLDILYTYLDMSVKVKDYSTVVKLCDQLIETENFYNIGYANSYLYLLNQLGVLPEDHKRYVECLTSNDLSVTHTENSLEEMTIKNNITRLLVIGDLQNSLCELKKLSSLRDLYPEERTLKMLIVQLSMKCSNQIESATSFVQKEMYEEAEKCLQEMPKSITRNHLANDLLDQLIEMATLKQIPEQKKPSTESLTQLIKSNQHEQAIELINRQKESRGVTRYNNLIETILKKIVSMKNQLVCGEKYKNLLQTLYDDNLDDFYPLLHDYLALEKKEELEPLLINFIRLDIAEENNCFLRIGENLKSVYYQNFDFCEKVHRVEFYSALAGGNLETSSIELDILKDGIKLGYPCPLISELSSVYEKEVKIAKIAENETEFSASIPGFQKTKER